MTERMKSTVQTEDSEHIPQTEQNGGTSTEDMKSKSLRNEMQIGAYRDWETDRKSTRLNSSHSGESRMPSSA